MASNIFKSPFSKDKGRVAWVYNSGVQAIANTTYTTLVWTNADIDSDNMVDLDTNMIRPKRAGYYLVNLVATAETADAQLIAGYVEKNGAIIAEAKNNGARVGDNISVIVPTIIYCDGVDDYFTLHMYQNSGASRNTPSGAAKHYVHVMYQGS